MNIIEVHLGFNGEFSNVNNPDTVVLHHADASHCTVFDIHKWHIARGFIGIGYHYFVNKEGEVYRGRPEKAIGAHCTYNADTLGICAEGRYMTETMPEVQKNAIIELIKDIKTRHNIKAIKKHSDIKPTDCPGTNYPFNEIVDGVNTVAAPTELKEGIVTATILNVRNGAGTQFKIIGTLKKGAKVKIDKLDGDWYSIYFGEHGGYVNKNYIKGC